MARPAAGLADHGFGLRLAALAAVLLALCARPAPAEPRGEDRASVLRADSLAGAAPPSAYARADSLARARLRALADSLQRAQARGPAAVLRSFGPGLLASAPSVAALPVAEGGSAAPGFTIRRIANPRYRPPNSGSPSLPVGATSAMRAMDWARAQLGGRGAGPSRVLDWLVSAGEDARRDRSYELEATGTHGAANSVLRTLRFDGRNGPLSGSLGDVPPVLVGTTVSLQRLRGGLFEMDRRDGTRLRVTGGVPTPVPGQSVRRISVGGVSVDDLPFDQARVSASAFAYGLGAAPAGPATAGDPDSLAGHGAMMSFGLRTPLGPGALSSVVTGGWHARGAGSGLGAQHALAWDMGTPSVVLGLRDERGAGRAVVLGSDRVAPVARSEDRWNAQVRTLHGRVETHFTGVVRAGGDPALETRTVTLGGSGALGASAWYGGGDLAWDRRSFLDATERRASVYAGRTSVRAALLLRVERSVNDFGRDLLTASGEGSLGLSHGVRLALEPRVGWNVGQVERGSVGTLLTWPLLTMGMRLGAGVTVGATREDGFRTRLQEAEITLSMAPRGRDRGDFEVRRLSDGTAPSLEYTASYDVQAPRYESAGGWLSSRRDSSRIEVQVVRTGNRTGVEDVLVSLDGSQLRFTDADGWAHFDHVPEGVHVVVLEERSLTPPLAAVSTTRVFVTIERGRLLEPVVFEVGRPERRQKF